MIGFYIYFSYDCSLDEQRDLYASSSSFHTWLTALSATHHCIYRFSHTKNKTAVLATASRSLLIVKACGKLKL